MIIKFWMVKEKFLKYKPIKKQLPLMNFSIKTQKIISDFDKEIKKLK